MMTPRSTVTRRLLAALDASPSRIPVLLGGCGSGRTTLLQQLHERLGRTSAQFIDVERTATTPERFHQAVGVASPFPGLEAPHPGARAAFDATLAFFRPRPHAERRAGHLPARRVPRAAHLRELPRPAPGAARCSRRARRQPATASSSPAATRRARCGCCATARAGFEVIHVPALSAEDTFDMLGPAAARLATPTTPTSSPAPYRPWATAGRPTCAPSSTSSSRCASTAAAMPSARWPSQLATGGRLSSLCEFCYELRLHRARGYGALKAILEILARGRRLTLTEISQRLQRTPGSTKDYLSWLEDVDLVTSRQKRYSFTDPLLRVWVRLHCRATVPER